MFVCASNQNGSFCGLPQSEWFLLGCIPTSSGTVLHLIFQEYYNKKATLCPAQTPNLVSLSLPISSQIPFQFG